MAQKENDLDDDLIRAEAELVATIQHLQSLGIKIPDTILDKTDWLTVKRYAERYNVTPEIVNNWITNGVIPADCTMVLPELNDIQLVKDQAYS
ncbi:hypothetical protein GCM10028807_60240 [Spirosoma daeguense]